MTFRSGDVPAALLPGTWGQFCCHRASGDYGTVPTSHGTRSIPLRGQFPCPTCGVTRKPSPALLLKLRRGMVKYVAQGHHLLSNLPFKKHCCFAQPMVWFPALPPAATETAFSSPWRARRHKLRIPRSRVNAKARSLRCASSLPRKPLRWVFAGTLGSWRRFPGTCICSHGCYSVVGAVHLMETGEGRLVDTKRKAVASKKT